MTTDYLYFGLHLRKIGNRLFVVDPGRGMILSDEWTAQEMELVSDFLRVQPRDRARFIAKSKPCCIEDGCENPRHKKEPRCKMHASLYHRLRRFKGCKTPEEITARREELARRCAESVRRKKEAGKFVKWKPPKVEIPCDRCREAMPHARYDICAKCRRDDDIARAQRKIDARLAREALRREKLEAKAAKKAPKPIDYSTQGNLKKYLSCKDCTKYVLRELAVARYYCSEECRDNNSKRYRRDLPSDSMRI